MPTFNGLVKEEENLKDCKKVTAVGQSNNKKMENEVSWKSTEESVSKWTKKLLWDLTLWKLVTKVIGTGES